MAIMEVVLEQSYAGQQCINRWNYIASGSPASVTLSFALASALGAIYDALAVPPAYPPTGLMRIIAAIQNNGVLFENITVKNLYSVTDFYSTPFVNPLTGGNGGDGESPMVAFGYYTNRVRTDVRRATKRFVGVAKEDIADEGAIAAPHAAAMTALANAMSANLTYIDEGNTLTFTPAVCGKEKYTVPDSPAEDPRYAYRYYATEAAQLQKTAQGIIWDWYQHVRSQTSRQYGRGR